MTVARSGGADVVVGAPVDAVWRVVSDVTRTGEWSHECRSVAWFAPATVPVPGARFRGRNRSGWVRWSRTCELTAVDPSRELAWRTVSSPLYPDSTAWRIQLEPTGSATRIRMSYQVSSLPAWFERIVSVTTPAHADRTAGLTADLRRLGELAARESAPTPAEG